MSHEHVDINHNLMSIYFEQLEQRWATSPVKYTIYSSFISKVLMLKCLSTYIRVGRFRDFYKNFKLNRLLIKIVNTDF